MAAALATIRHRVQRLLVRRGLEPGDDPTGRVDRLADEFPVLAGIVGASVQGRVALGPRAEARVRRLGHERDTAAVTSRGPRQAHLGGLPSFDLHQRQHSFDFSLHHRVLVAAYHPRLSRHLLLHVFIELLEGDDSVTI